MAQNSGLFPQFTVQQNVCLVAKLKGWSQAQLKERFENLLSVANVRAQLANKYPCQLSGGEKTTSESHESFVL